MELKKHSSSISEMSGWTADDADEARVIEDGRGAQEIFLDVMMRGFSPDEIDCMRGCTERNLKDDNV